MAAMLAALALAPAAHAQLRVGIGDQKPSMFSDPRFQALDVHYSRLVVAWDALTVGWQRREVDAWMAAAKQDDVHPLVVFGHSRRKGRTRQLPTPRRFAAEFRRFRKRYPQVTDFATWNEANLCGEPTCRKPALVARYYKALRHVCPRCRVLAASLLDFPNMVSWVRRFRAAAKVDPPYWGMHNYRDTNRLTTENTRKLLRATSGEIWLTEVGGIVKRRNKSSVYFEESAAHAAKATRWLFDHIVTLSPRISRVYLYHWSAATRNDTWDSALIGPNGRPRPALSVVRAWLDARRPPLSDPPPPPPAPAPAPLG